MFCHGHGVVHRRRQPRRRGTRAARGRIYRDPRRHSDRPGNWVIEISEDQFSASASGGTMGILRFFSRGHGVTKVEGTVAAGQPLPTTYTSTITNQDRTDDVRMSFAGGNVKDFTVEPPLGPNNDRIPVTDGDRRNVLDPMTSTLDPVNGAGDPLSPASLQPQGGGVRWPHAFRSAQRIQAHGEWSRRERLSGAGRGLRGLFHADFRLRAEPLRHQIPRAIARCRSLARADRRHAGAGAVPVLVADAGRHWGCPGDAVHLGGKTTACRSQRESTVKASGVLGALSPLRQDQRPHGRMLMGECYNVGATFSDPRYSQGIVP